MRIDTWLSQSQARLKAAGIATSRLDCLVLLEDQTGRERSWLLAHPEYILQKSELKNLHTKITQRALHIPLAYLRNKAEFYGREFIVNEHVLVPRPETETMIDILKTLPLPPRPTLVDIGTGSGAIGVTAKLECPTVKVIATDIDSKALEIAHKNAQQLRADITLLHGDLLEPLSSNIYHPTSILANLPYVPERYTINQAAAHEPKHAIFGGKDGLNLYRRLWEGIAALPNKPAFVLTESLPPQHEDMNALAKDCGYKLYQSQDFIQVFTRP